MVKSKSIFVFIIFMVNIASPAIADEDNIFEGSKPINIERILEVTDDVIIREAAEQVNRINIADPANITKNVETWDTFKAITQTNGTYVGAPFEEDKIRVNNSGTVIVSGLMSAPSDAIMSGASEGWFRIPLDLNVNETYQKCTTKFFREYEIYEPFTPSSSVTEFKCSQNLDVRMQIYHIGNPGAFDLEAEGYPNFNSKWSSDDYSEWSTMELYDSYYEHSISPLAHPTKVWDKVYRHTPRDDKCSPQFEYPDPMFGMPLTLEEIMPQQIADYYGNLSTAIPQKCIQAINSGTPLTGEDIRYDIDNRTYLWWSFPFYPDEHYAYIIETNNSMIFPELFITTADLGDDGIYTSFLKLEDNMFHNFGQWALDNSGACNDTFIGAGGAIFPHDGAFYTEPCNIEMTWDNITLPIDLGHSMLFTQGNGYGVRGLNITSTATVYEAAGSAFNSKFEYRTPLNGILFYDRLPRQFNSTNDRLTFTMPFSLPDATGTNTTDYLEKAIVTTCVQALNKTLVPISQESWNCNQQVASDHVIISGRDSDVNVTANPNYAQNTWGSGICYNPFFLAGCDSYGDYGIWEGTGGGFEQVELPPFAAPLSLMENRLDRHGDEFLDGAEYLKFWMSWEILDNNVSSSGTLPTHCQYGSGTYSIACKADGTRIWLHDFAADEMDEDSQLLNSVYIVQGGNLTASNGYPEQEGYFDHQNFKCSNLIPPTCFGYPDNLLQPQYNWTGKYSVANGISMWNNSINLKHYNWRPFHTTEISEGTLANLNPVQTGTIFKFNLEIEYNNQVYTNCQAAELVPTIMKEIESGEIMLNSFDFKASGLPLSFAENGFCGKDNFKEIYNFVEQTTEQCRSLDPRGNGEGGFCKPGMLNWQLREIVEIEGVSLLEASLPFIEEVLSFIVNRIEQNVNALLELVLFLVPFTVFIIGVAIIWHATRMLIYLIRGELDMAQELADFDRYGLAGISRAFKNLDYARRRPKE